MSILKQIQSRRPLNEGMRKIGELHSDSGNHHATIHKDHEWGEYRVKFHSHGVHNPKADYHTDDKHDAHGTAEAGLKHLDATNKTVHEGSEQIDEISNDTLVSYAKKAHKSMGQSIRDYGHHKDMKEITGRKSDEENMKKASKTFSKRRKGLNMAAKKSSDVDYISRHEDIQDLSNDSQLTEEHFDFILDNMTIEEFEQLDEISKKTLGSYIRRANADSSQAHRDHVMDMGHVNQKTLNSHLKRAEKRNDGIRKAVSRLTKEDVDHIDEVSDGTKFSYASKVTSKIAGHDAAHQKHANLAKRLEAGGSDDAFKGYVHHSNEAARHAQKADVHSKARKKVVAKLASEEVEHIDEAKVSKHVSVKDKVHMNHTAKKFPKGAHVKDGSSHATILGHGTSKGSVGVEPHKHDKDGGWSTKTEYLTRVHKAKPVKEGRLLSNIIEDAINKGGRPKKARTLDGKIAPGA